VAQKKAEANVIMSVKRQLPRGACALAKLMEENEMLFSERDGVP